MRAAAGTVEAIALLLGGKSANLVFPDVDVASTAAYCAMFGVSNSGQGCALPTRIIVHESIYYEFLAVVSTTLRNMPFGDPLIRSVMVGPMVNQAACQRVQKMIDAARHAGAGVVAVGGASVPERYAPGNFVMPTLFRDVVPDSEIAQREIFGPVLCLFKFSDEDQGVGLANSTEYGLAADVQTNDLNVAQRMSRRLRAGSVFVNQATPSNLAATPFGGMGLSGFGREGGKAGLRRIHPHEGRRDERSRRVHRAVKGAREEPDGHDSNQFDRSVLRTRRAHGDVFRNHGSADRTVSSTCPTWTANIRIFRLHT